MDWAIKAPMLIEENNQFKNTKLIKRYTKKRVDGKGVSYFSLKVDPCKD